VLVLLDEFQNLGKLENALTAASVLGGYGVPCWFFVQSLRAVDNVYTREGRQTLVNSARVQIFLGAQDPEDQRYVSQLLGERKDVTIDKAISTGATLFDRKGATMSHRSAMRPLMRPDELGAMNEARCIIKIRNQQPIFGVRNLYYADRHLATRAWQPIRRAKDRWFAQGPPSTKTDNVAERAAIDHAGAAAIVPGVAFVEKHTAAVPKSSRQRSARDQRGDAGIGEAGRSPSGIASEGGAPDFRRAMARSAGRKADAERTLDAVLSLLEETPKKTRAARKLRRDVAMVFADE